MAMISQVTDIRGALYHELLISQANSYEMYMILYMISYKIAQERLFIIDFVISYVISLHEL